MSTHPLFKHLLRGVLLIGLTLGVIAAHAQSASPKEGQDFISLKTPVPKEAAKAKKVEVIEFFMYSCPHCNAFEPQLQTWVKSQKTDVEVVKVPLAFNEKLVPHQKLFYAIEALKLSAKGKQLEDLKALHGKIFTAIHTERQALATPQEITQWVSKQGVDASAFNAAYNSFGVANSVQRANQLANLFKVDGVPALGINGRFYTDGAMAGGMIKALQTVDFLVAQVRAGK
jgi:protein dithiol oxidoreductase (disulfide-forming)